jgi:hypothetical protein
VGQFDFRRFRAPAFATIARHRSHVTISIQSVSQVEYCCPQAATRCSSASQWIFLKESLMSKYGKPISVSGCGDADDLHSCEMLFRSEGQSVSADVTVTAEGVPLGAYIIYTPSGAAKGL